MSRINMVSIGLNDDIFEKMEKIRKRLGQSRYQFLKNAILRAIESNSKAKKHI
ncbi:MAG: hypothetical protein ACTSX6_00345 [Candidatus Heimdallarchaeaceae archaeon]